MMKTLNITIPDNKESIFIEWMKSISFVKKIEVEKTDISQWHKAVIDQRLENFQNNPESYLDWDEIQKDINKKYEL